MAGKSNVESGGMYDKRDFGQGPSTYKDDAFMDKIVAATRLMPGRSAVVLDAMSGPGLVGKGINERVPGNTIDFLDKSKVQLDAIPEGLGRRRIQADVRDLPPSLTDSTDVVVVRYGIKDVRQGEQQGVLAGLNRVSRQPGSLVVADMVAPDGAQDWLNAHHALKQEFQGRDSQTEGACHIPTEQEWTDLLEGAGFVDIRADHHVSRVTTNKWVMGGKLLKNNVRRWIIIFLVHHLK